MNDNKKFIHILKKRIDMFVVDKSINKLITYDDRFIKKVNEWIYWLLNQSYRNETLIKKLKKTPTEEIKYRVRNSKDNKGICLISIYHLENKITEKIDLGNPFLSSFYAYVFYDCIVYDKKNGERLNLDFSLLEYIDNLEIRIEFRRGGNPSTKLFWRENK